VTRAIRAATPADAPLMLRFVRELAEYERAADKVVATEADLVAALAATPPAMEAVIAEDGGAPLGFALFFHNYSTWTGFRGVYLEDLYVTPEARGRGVGKALLAHVAAIAVERRCARFEWSVLDWNEPAIGFYRSLGAKPMDEWTVFRLTSDGIKALAESGVR
jgi:GNAT superfamily N-acetyltransferase